MRASVQDCCAYNGQEDRDQETAFLSKAESFIANIFAADVAARAIMKANTRYAATKTKRETLAAEVPPERESTFDLDFSLSIWDPVEWYVH